MPAFKSTFTLLSLLDAPRLVEGGLSGFQLFGAQSAAAPTTPPLSSASLTDVSQSASDFLGGSIDAFLGSARISATERACLSDGAQSLTSDLAVAWDTAMQTYTAFKSQTASAAAQQMGASSAAALPASVTPGESAVIAMEMSASLSNIFQVESDLAKKCLRGDVEDELVQAVENLGNMTFVGGRLLSNGVDIVEEISSAFTAYEHQNFRAFGKDLGTAGRKVLLAKRSTSSGFSEPSSKDITDLTQGLFASFFGSGMHLQLATDAVPASAVEQPALATKGLSASTTPLVDWGLAAVMTAAPGSGIILTSTTAMPPTLYPATTLDVNLRTCIKGNMPLLKSAWKPVFQLLSKATGSTSAAESPDMSELMLSMMDLQVALTRCNVGPAQEAMLIDAIESGTKIHSKLQLANSHTTGSGVASLLTSALEDFRDKHWYEFGDQLGKAMQDMVVVTFAQKYEVDDVGRLRSKLLGASEIHSVHPEHSSFGAAELVGAGILCVMVVAALVTLRRRQHVRSVNLLQCEADESAEDLEAIE